MTTEIDNLKAQIKQATNYQINKEILREKIQTDLCLPYNGGLFKVTPTLLSFLATWPGIDVFLEDEYQNPIQVNAEEFLGLARQHYQKVMNEWNIQHEQLRQIRKI